MTKNAGLSFPDCSLLLFVFLMSCHNQNVKQPAVAVKNDTVSKRDASVKGAFSDQQILYLDRSHIKKILGGFPLLGKYVTDVQQFYNYRNNSYAWYETTGLIEEAGNLYTHLNNLQDEGILESAPYIKTLDTLINDPAVTGRPDSVLEILLTAEYLFYADRVWNGISENQTTKLQWYIPRKKLDLPFITDSLIRDTSAPIFSDDYSFRQYNLLKATLKKYRQLETSAEWKPIDVKNKYKLNDRSPDITLIRKKLYELGDLKQDDGSEIFDDGLQTGIKLFQTRYGMTDDGIAGTEFLRYLNTPIQDYIRKIIINMERARWLPLDLKSHYLIINIPSFTLYAYDLDTLDFSMNVVVGRNVHKTVLFSGDIKYVVFSPYWDIPPSILKNEILPGIQKDPNYLKRNNMEWVGNRVRQKPGPKNSLGLVKFLFPNSYNIYLHDTPAKSLFQQSTRAFSHGCIRLGEPEKLAVYLLRNDSDWTETKIDAAMHKGVEKYVTLKNPVPVYIGYMTAFVDNKGRINFRDDIYKRDGALGKMIIK
ncbi:MAG TPA: L,D-transpeptidase family protein [Puia sp.]|nr:L,D-transpeptidase family protein [Puia sp.]